METTLTNIFERALEFYIALFFKGFSSLHFKSCSVLYAAILLHLLESTQRDASADKKAQQTQSYFI